jgi:hypothetical protein
MLRLLVLSLTLGGESHAAADPAPPPPPSPEAIEFFEKKVRPLLVENCYSCHGPKKQNAGLRLDTAAGAKQGADDGAVLVPGDPAKSRLIAAVRREGDFPMPPKDPLPAEAVAVLTEWVKLGAPYPAGRSQAANPDPRTHWAFQPVSRPEIPKNKTPSTNPIDAFVFAKLQASGLSPSPPADKRTLIRRAHYDLIGLPPTFEEVEDFAKDASRDAYEKLIDRLLASPHYGERWGRYWLDVARYADTKGYVFQEVRDFPYAYTYRDYVVRSFNEDKPFDRFIIEQLAADKLDLGDDKRPLAAMGYLTLGRRFLNNTHDIIDDRIDVVTRGMMGITVTCARCHDHKFDPIPIADYYSLYGVFASSVEPKELPLIGEVEQTPEVIAFEKEVAKRTREYDAEVKRRFDAEVRRLRTPQSIAAQIRGALDAKGIRAEELRGFARQRDLSSLVLERWRDYIGEQTKKRSPTFALLSALHAIPVNEFEAKAADVIAGFGKGVKRPAPGSILKALDDAEPKSFREAVEAVAKVLAGDRDGVGVFERGGPLDLDVNDFPRFQNRADRDQLRALLKKIDSFKASNPAAPPRAHVLNDTPRPFDPVVFLRGNPGNRGPNVPRRMPEIIAGEARKPFAGGSGRLDLAKAIASSRNPLTARVFVNRVWIGHFGQGLVRTPSDFGVRSDPPTHPELLDWLATRFIEDGWSAKKLHKLIMMSATYRQASTTSPAIFQSDPDNRLLAHQNRRRLDFEAMRDSLLAVSGRLDRTIGGRPVDLFQAPFPTRRTIYGKIDRSNFPGTFRSFDVASPDQHSPQRFQTTVPQQALFLLNSPFVVEQARALAKRVEGKSDEERIRSLYHLAFGREQAKEELALGREFVAAAEAKNGFGPWEQYAQVLLLSNEFAFVD